MNPAREIADVFISRIKGEIMLILVIDLSVKFRAGFITFGSYARKFKIGLGSQVPYLPLVQSTLWNKNGVNLVISVMPASPDDIIDVVLKVKL